MLVGGVGQGHLTLAMRDGADGRVLAAVTLDCGPDGGTHPDPAGACRRLAAAGGQIARIQGRREICSMIYLPVTVTVRGEWGGRKVAYTHTYGNRCVARTAAGGLFRF